MNRTTILYVPFAVLLLALPAVGNMKMATTPGPSGIELRLISAQKDFKLGGVITIRAEIWNLGRDVFYVSRLLQSVSGAPAQLTLSIFDRHGDEHPLQGWHAIYSFAAANDWWNKLLPYHYEGVEILLQPEDYREFAPKAGRYKFAAEYISQGGNTPASPEWQVMSHPVWKGRIESPAIWIKLK